MDDPLLRERNPKPKPTKEKVLILVIALFILVLSLIAFFVALNNYLRDQKARTLIASDQEILQSIILSNQLNERTQTDIINKEEQLDQLQARCTNVITEFEQDQAILINEVQPVFDLWTTINNTIYTENTNCENTINQLNRTFTWLTNVTTVNSTLVYNGLCRWNSIAIANQSIDVSFNYKVLPLNGIDFYFYEFINSTDVVDASLGVTIQGCSPRIFKGQPKVNKALNSDQLSVLSLESSPLSAVDYLSHVEFGGETLAFIPKVVPSINQTLRITEYGLRLWTNILF